VLDEPGLVASLEFCVNLAGLEARGIVPYTHIDPALKDLDEGPGITLYRLLQEALANVCRHSEAKNVWIRAEWHPDERGVSDSDADPAVIPGVEDDGQGLQASSRGSGGLGLAGARERVEALGGSFDVDEGDAGGTRLRATIPCVGVIG
jgi:two-component system, NarL family, sensor histidine kinase UhpB